jgi:hypothetical protein
MAARLALALLLLWVGAAHAQPSPQVSLVTFSPGDIYWQRFGHNALVVRDGLGGPRLYNYGTFDFRQKNFFLNFARGRMLYRLDVAPLDEVLYVYARENRWAVEQRLNLTSEQAQKMTAFLAWNALPQNAEYRYEYFTDNCSTRVRDVLDMVLDGALRRQLDAQPTGVSLRQEATRLISPHRLLMLGMDLGMGPRADRSLTLWQHSFVPMTLMEAVRTIRIGEEADSRPLVAGESMLLTAERVPPPAAAPGLFGGFLLAGLGAAFGLGGLLAGRGRLGLVGSRLACVLAGLLGLSGLLLTLGWALTEHWVMAQNRNLLLVNPLWLLLLPALWQLRSVAEPARWAQRLAMVIAAGAVLALIALGLPLPQQQEAWLALLLPLNLVLVAGLLLRRGDSLRP